MFRIFCLIILVVPLLSNQALARIPRGKLLLDASLYYVSIKTQDAGGPESTSTSSLYDIRFGKIFQEGWYLGAIYTMRSQSTGSTTESGNAAGVSAGFMGNGGFFIQGHYLLMATNGDYKKGTGLQFAAGYKVDLADNWLLGVEITQRIITYKELNSLDVEFKTTELYPMISIGRAF